MKTEQIEVNLEELIQEPSQKITISAESELFLVDHYDEVYQRIYTHLTNSVQRVCCALVIDEMYLDAVYGGFDYEPVLM
ncbi:MAG: hypothetical protein MAG795_00533 [Candidatus Woesearchaeota archaeon]|nr:hypothetical protein [Candidatus Woesearchaeota archaeon]